MIRHKTMRMFKAILVVTALCLVPSSRAGDDCIFCDSETGKNYMYCVVRNMAINPNFQKNITSLQQMTSDLGKVAKDMNDGPMKDNVMKGAMAYSLGSMASQDENSNIIDIITSILKQCCKVVNKDSDEIFLNDCKVIAEQKRNWSSSQQTKNQTPSDKIPENSQNANYPIPYGSFPQTQEITILSNDKSNPSQENIQRKTFSPDQQYPYQYDNVFQQQDSASAASAYSGQQKNQWNQFVYNREQAQRQNSYQQPITNQGNANAGAFAISSYSPLPKQQSSTSYMPNAQKMQPVDTYKQPQNYQKKVIVYPNTNRGDFSSNVNNSSYPQTPVNGENSQSYGDNQNANSNNWALAYSNTRQQNNNFYNRPYRNLPTSASPRAIPQNNYAYSSSSSGSSAASSNAFSSSTNDGGSYATAISSSKSNINSPGSNYQYPLPQTIQRKPNTNALPTGNKPQLDAKQQDVPTAKDDKTSNAKLFSQTLYGEMCDGPSVETVINQKTTKDQLQYIMKYIIFYALNMCGYPKEMAQKCVDDSNNFAKALPQGLPTSMQVKAICEMMKIELLSANMIGDNPVGQAKCLGYGMKAGLEQLQKSLTSPESQQNLPTYPTKSVNYDDKNSNNYAANQQTEFYGVTNKQPNNVGDQYLDDKPIAYDDTTKVKTNKQSDQSNVDTDTGATNSDDDDDDDGFDDDDDYLDDDDDYDGFYDDDDDDGFDDNDDAIDTMSLQDSNSLPKQANQPNAYNVNDQSADNKFKQPSKQQQLFDNQQTKLKDSDFTKTEGKSTYLKSTGIPPLSQLPSDASQSPDLKKSNAAVNTIADSKDRVKMLMKLALACFQGGDFDFKKYSKDMAMVANMTKNNHPEMGPEEVKTLTLIDALYAVISILKSILKENPDYIQKLQVTYESLQFPQNTLLTYQNPQDINPNSNYQTGQTTKNPPAEIPDQSVNPPIQPAPVSSSQNQAIQNSQWRKDYNPPAAIQDQSVNQPVQPAPSPQFQATQNNQWRTDYNTNQNPYSVIQPQTETTSASQQTNSNIFQNKDKYNDWNAGNQQWQKNQNSVRPLNDNIGDTPQFVPPVIQDKFASPPAIQPPGPMQNIAYPPQNQENQNNQWRNNDNTNKNSYPSSNNWYNNQSPNNQNGFFHFGTPGQSIVSQQPSVPSNGNNFQNFPGDQAGFQQERVNNLNGMQNGNNFQNSPGDQAGFQQERLNNLNGMQNGNNFQNSPGDQAGFQQERVNNLNGMQNGNQFGWNNVNIPGGGQPGNQLFSDPSTPNLDQSMNRGTYNSQDRGFNAQEQNANNWYPQQRVMNAPGNQGFGGAGQTGNYQQNSFPQNNAPLPGNQWN